MENLIRDIQYGLRALAREKGFSATVVLTLAVCIAANTAMFAIVHSILLRPLPGPNSDRIVMIANRYPKAGGSPNQVTSSGADYYDRLRSVTALDEQALFRSADRTVDIQGTATRMEGMAVTPSFFRLVGVAPAVGRGFTTEEGETGADHKVILSDAFSRQLFGAGSPLGRTLRIGAEPYTIVGVMPPGFVFVEPEVRLWTPLALDAHQKTQHHNNSWVNIGRLRPGATIAQAQAQVDALNKANLDRFPEFKQILIDAGFHSRVEPLRDMLVKEVKGALYLLWGGAAFVLLIGGLNVANLVLARTSVRKKELATRLALGAGRARLARQLIVENVLVALTGGVAGVGLGWGLLQALSVIGLDRLPRAAEVRIDGTVIVVALALAVVVGVLIGLAPLAGILRSNVNQMLRDSGRSGTGGAGVRRVRQALVAAEVAFAFVLAVGAGLLLASFRQLLAVDPGFTAGGVMTATSSAPQARYAGDAELGALMNRMLESVRRQPGLQQAGATTTVPFSGDHSDSVILAEGYQMKSGESVISPSKLSVTPGYFDTMRIRLLRGRDFDARDDVAAPPVIIIDEQLARHFWPGQDPVGRRMYQPDSPDVTKTGPNTRWLTVVGVVRTVRMDNVAGNQSASGAYYFPYAQEPQRVFTIVARSTLDEAAQAPALRAAISAVDPGLALFNVRTMTEWTELSLASRRTAMLLAVGFGAVAMLLSAIGIYGVLAYLVARRRREIGIRAALGCTGAGIVRLVLAEGLTLVALGLCVGLAGAVVLRKAVASQVYGVQPMDPLVLGGAMAMLGTVALIACIEPARRALRVDPVRVLADE